MDKIWFKKSSQSHHHHHHHSPVKKKIRVSIETTAKDLDDMSSATHNSSSSGDLLQSLLNSPGSGSPSSKDDPMAAAAAAAAAGDPPEPEELVKAIQELEHAASSDASVRERIAKLPPDVSEVSQLAELKSPQAGRDLLKRVDDAVRLLDEYNERLQKELKDRKKVGKMIEDMLAAQKDLEAQAEERLEQYRDKLEKVDAVKAELKSHVQSLPDLSKLPDIGGLAPLPSAGDLFTSK